MENYKKKYEDLISSLKKAKDDEMVCDDRFCVVIDNIVPELKESEDERIRKELIQYFEKVELHYMNREEILAWLEKQGEKNPAEWSESDSKILAKLMFCIHSQVFPSKEERDDFLSWLKFLKDRVQPQSKQEWSEEDEKIRNWLVDELQRAGHPQRYYDAVKWLKSLRPQNTWKPSEEQVEYLRQGIELFRRYASYCPVCLLELYEDLKKL